MPLQKKLLTNNIFDKGKTIINISAKTLTEAVKKHDDLQVLSQIDSIIKIEDVFTAYILDGSGMVITHNKTSQWGKLYNDKVSDNAIHSKKLLIQKTEKLDGYIFSIPLTSSSTFCIGLSSARNIEIINSNKKTILYTVLILLIFYIFILFLINKYYFFSRFEKFENLLKSLSIEKTPALSISGNDEFTRFVKILNSELEKFSKNKNIFSNETVESMEKLKNLLNESAKYIEQGIMIIDHENKIICINEKAENILSITNSTGMHILDISLSQEIITLFKKSSNQVNILFEENLKFGITDILLKITTLGKSKTEIYGTIVIFNKNN